MSAKLDERDWPQPGDHVVREGWDAPSPLQFGVVREVVPVPGRAWPDVVVEGSGGEISTWDRRARAYMIDDDDTDDEVGPIEHRISSFRRVVARGMDREAAARMYGLDLMDPQVSSAVRAALEVEGDDGS
jgi:hypothetical protein